MTYYRLVEEKVAEYLKSPPGKILFIWGPRRSGKTTLLEKTASQQGNLPIFNFDFHSHQEKFVPRREVTDKLASENPILFIDEVQNYPEATQTLKVLIDHYPIKIIATGSSELRQKSEEFDSLAGRFIEAYCLPLSVEEIFSNTRVKAYEEAELAKQAAEQAQIFGLYPEVYLSQSSVEEKAALLQNILDMYVLKDIITIYNLKNTKLAKDILTMLALQLGQEVSIREIANSLQSTAQTVSNYIEIFIKNYVLIPLPSFKTNLRRAVSLNRKLYFYDMGIRNILAKDFRPTALRPDKGAVFENFVISEIEKRIRNHRLLFSKYFYREYHGREVDLILEDYMKEYFAFEIKVQEETAKPVFPLEHSLTVINKANYRQKISGIYSTL
jgi:predicted AAA+ superfamily ATPase